MTRDPPHLFGMQWDVHFRRDMSRLRKLAASASGFQRLENAVELAEQYVKALHVYFYNPLAGIEWHDGLFVLRLRMPKGMSVDLALGSYGTAHYVVKGPQGYDDVSCPDGVVLGEVLLRDLIEYGLNVRPISGRPRRQLTLGPARVSSEPSVKAKMEKMEERSATVSRRTVRNPDGVDEDAIDRANAETATSDDDARIVKVKLDGGPGNTVVLHGIRQGLGGTSSKQRIHVDCVTVEVRTMNPDAKVSIDPPDCEPDVPGHRVLLPDGEDTTITVTATAADGVTTSEFRHVAQRSPASHEK